MFTNFGDLNLINKKASKVFFGHPEAFLQKSTFRDVNTGPCAEKSTRNVYDALSMDFDALEMG